MEQLSIHTWLWIWPGCSLNSTLLSTISTGERRCVSLKLLCWHLSVSRKDLSLCLRRQPWRTPVMSSWRFPRSSLGPAFPERPTKKKRREAMKSWHHTDFTAWCCLFLGWWADKSIPALLAPDFYSPRNPLLLHQIQTLKWWYWWDSHERKHIRDTAFVEVADSTNGWWF